MKQVYLIRKTYITGKKEEYLEPVFDKYHQSRNLALKLVKIYNRKIQNTFFTTDENPFQPEMKEIIPDKWTNGFDSIEIEVFRLKDLMNQQKSKNGKKFLLKLPAINETIYF